MRPAVVVAGVALAVGAVLAPGYPLDGDKKTGIRRLTGFRLAQEGKVAGPKLPEGALWPEQRVMLRLTGYRDLDVAAGMGKDPELQRGLEQILGGRSASYGMALLDITDPKKPRYAAVNEDNKLLPGSVGKLLVATGMMAALRTNYPDTAQRERFLRETVRAADGFVIQDSKTVPFFNEGAKAVTNRPIAIGDRFSLYEWLDHMLSVSSNAAGAYTWKEALLLHHFGKSYPVGTAEEKGFLTKTPKPDLSKEALETLEEPLRAAGIDTGSLRLGTFFTSGGSRTIPGTSSYGTPRELMRWLVRLEQGRIVDEWSSLELKKLLYFSRSRYRYAASPALRGAGVFFKSGSFFECTPEPGFVCKAYAGNRTNIMNSVAVVESGSKVYLVTLMSNVLRVNSASEHERIAGLVEKLVQGSVSGSAR